MLKYKKLICTIILSKHDKSISTDDDLLLGRIFLTEVMLHLVSLMEIAVKSKSKMIKYIFTLFEM